jgi:hypothetical protein
MNHGSTDVFYDGKVHVRAVQCDRCLFGPARLVSGARARAIVTSSQETEGGSFICHRGQVSDEPTAICAVWWERFAMRDNLFRLAVALDVVERV